MITSFSPVQTKSTVRFGDALFERHADFSEDKLRRQQTKHDQELLKSGDVDRVLDSTSQQAKNLQDPTGRFADNRSSLSTSAKLANREARLRENKLRNTLLSHTPDRSQDQVGDRFILRSHSVLDTAKRRDEVEMALQEAKVKKANAVLAQNISPASNKKAYNQLGLALDTLERKGYFDKDKIDPALVHGWANRGVHTFDHDVFDTTVETYGEETMVREEAIFEGMAIAPADDDGDMKLNAARMKAELPFLKKAIALTRKMEGTPDQRSLAKAEYLNRLAEIQHGLSHHEYADSDNFEHHSQQARQAIQRAHDAVEDLGSGHKTPYQKRLESNLRVKHNHLCSRHKPHMPPAGGPGEELCRTLDTQMNPGKIDTNVSPDFLNFFKNTL